MKIIYKILFVVDLIVLVGLFYGLLKSMDKNENVPRLFETITGILASIVLLFFFVYRYIRLTSKKDS